MTGLSSSWIMSFRIFFVVSRLISSPVRDACAAIRIRQPSSSLMLDLILAARKLATSSGMFFNRHHVRFFVYDGELRLYVGRLNIRDKTHIKSRPQPVGHLADFLRRPVARNNDLFLFFVQGVEGVKKLFLGRGFFCDELHVVKQRAGRGFCIFPSIRPSCHA